MRRDPARPAGPDPGGGPNPAGARAAGGPPAGPASERYELRLLGPFTVLRHGRPVPDRALGSRKARLLLGRLLVERTRVVGTDALAELLWPDQLPDRPERQIATLVSRLRAALGSGIVVRAGSGYRFGGGPAYLVDLELAERLTGEAETRLAGAEPALAHSAAGRALELLDRGEPLADEPFADWAVPARTAAGALLRRARQAAWTAALAVGQPDLAVRAAGAALADDPFDEPAGRALMRGHRDRGEPGRALAAYERLRTALADELGTDPAGPTRELHRAILRDEPDPAGAPDRPGPASGDSGLVGRDGELAGLRADWSRAAAGTAGLVLLVGEAGIGKTRLAAALAQLAEATGGTVARARCHEAERSLFLQPVADALRPVVAAAGPELVRAAAGATAGSLAELVPEVGELLGPLAHQPAGPEVERRRLFEAVTGLVRGLAAHRPLLLFLDDLHLAGSSTLELLHFLARRVGGCRVLVLATVRAEESGEVLDTLGELATRRDIGPLPESAVRELARRSGAAELAGQIMARTRGHSLYVVESLRALAEQPAGGPVVPDSLRAAVVARIRRAGPEVEELLRAAATLGAGLDPRLVAALTERSVEETTRRAAAAGRARLLIEAGQGYEFANDLIREIAYETTPLPVRIARHRRAAELLAGHPEAVAGHAARAGDWPAALAANLQAAEAAARRYANRDAERLLEQALRAADRADDPVGLARARLARGRIREVLTDYPGAYEDHSSVVELARRHGRADLELAALNQLGGDILVGLGRPTRECIPYLEAALKLAESTGDRAVQVDILGRLAVIWTNRLRFDLASQLADRAVRLADEHRSPTGRALALDAVKTILAYRGRVTELAELLPRLEHQLHRYQQGRNRYRWPQLSAWTALESAFPALARAQWEPAADRIGQALALIRQSGYVAYEPVFLAHLAWLERARGHYREALRHGRQAVALAGETGHPWWTALAVSLHGWTLTELGAAGAAVECLEQGLAGAERDATEGYLVRCLGHLAWACAVAGEPGRAAGLAQRCEALLAAATGGPFLHGAHACLATAAARLATGQPAAAGRLLAPVRRAAAEQGWLEIVAWADLLAARCRWAAGDPEPAARLAGAALAVAGRVELPGIAAPAHRLLAELPAGAAGPGQVDTGGTDTGGTETGRTETGRAGDPPAAAGAGGPDRHRAAAARIAIRLAATLDEPELREGYLAQAGIRL